MSDERWHIRAVALTGAAVGSAADDEPTDWWIADGRLLRERVDGARDLPGRFIAPGLVDAHAHLTFEARDRLGLKRGSPELVAAHLDLQRAAGVLAVRDAGSLPGVTLEPRPASGGRIVACGPFLAPPDFYFPHLYEGTPPDGAVEGARERVRAGWPWVKVIADVPGPGGNPLDPRLGYPFELVAAIADAVHEEGGRLAVHAMGRIVGELVAAGVDSIEHGNWATEDDVRAMAERGTGWTPTLTTVLGHIEPLADRVPPARELLEHQRRALPLAAALGVTLLTGTDEEPHGSVAAEAAALVRYGVPPAAAVDAAGAGARRFLALPGLEDGAPADVVTFADDPREDIAALAAPAAVVVGGVRL